MTLGIGVGRQIAVLSVPDYGRRNEVDKSRKQLLRKGTNCSIISTY